MTSSGTGTITCATMASCPRETHDHGRCRRQDVPGKGGVAQVASFMNSATHPAIITWAWIMLGTIVLAIRRPQPIFVFRWSRVVSRGVGRSLGVVPDSVCQLPQHDPSRRGPPSAGGAVANRPPCRVADIPSDRGRDRLVHRVGVHAVLAERQVRHGGLRSVPPERPSGPGFHNLHPLLPRDPAPRDGRRTGKVSLAPGCPGDLWADGSIRFPAAAAIRRQGALPARSRIGRALARDRDPGRGLIRDRDRGSVDPDNRRESCRPF